MSSSTGRTKCSICSKEKTTAKCSGCSKDFCLNHLVEHHQQLQQQFTTLENERDTFRQTLSAQQNRREGDLFMERINQWEADSIVEIQRVAEEQRQVLRLLRNEHLCQIERQFEELSEKLKESEAEGDFNEIILTKLQDDLKQLEKELGQPSNITLQTEASAFIGKISISRTDGKSLLLLPMVKMCPHPLLSIAAPLTTQTSPIFQRWKQNGITVVGGNGCGNSLNQCSDLWSICINDQGTIYVADTMNHRILKWKNGATEGKIVAGGNGEGGRHDQLAYPCNIIMDYRTNALIIADRGNKRVVRWPRRRGASGEIILSNVNCWGLALDSHGYLYVSDIEKHEVRRWKIGENEGMVVAGGKGRGDRFDQLDGPRYLFVDKDETIYVSDEKNHRVMKWFKGADEGVVVAGGRGKGSALSQLSAPQGIMVDPLGTVYVADLLNDRMMRWFKGATEGAVVVGGNGSGQRMNQFDGPTALALDVQNNLHVADRDNHRVQKFLID